MRQRIQTLDGLRFLAAIGVLWIHAWTLCGNPRYYIAGIDVASILAIGGNGVDLFFVISGFCMYYFYASKSNFSYHDFYRFIVKRWVRLSTAFYAATLVFMLVASGRYHTPFSPIPLFTSVFYLNSIFPQYTAATHFWTLGVEWQFYLVVPFLLIYQNRTGFTKTFTGIFGLLLFVAIASVFIFKSGFDLLTEQIIYRGSEFGCGVVIARLLYTGRTVLRNRIFCLVLFLVLTYAGRIMISKTVLSLLQDYYNLFKVIGFAVMAAGFAGILFMALTSAKWLNLLLGNRVFKTMGRISYSFYLWHPLVLSFAGAQVVKFIPVEKGMITPVAITIASTILLYPISLLSYALLEKPFLSVGNLSTK
ncbi:MAG TPA: acyltransferase [Mucilaginibacter sp.]|nr:acyltransferase [Mucilaginibacter sp.]